MTTRPSIPRNILKGKLEALSAKHRRKSCEPLWLGGVAGDFLLDHWQEVENIMYGLDKPREE